MIDLTDMISRPVIVKQPAIQKLRLVIVILLVILVIMVFSYIGTKEDGPKNDVELNETMTKVFSEGIQYGILTAVAEVMKQLQNCNIVSLNSNNTTVNIIDIDCVR